MTKQEIIKRLTDLVSTIQGYYFKGRTPYSFPFTGWTYKSDKQSHHSYVHSC